MAFSLSQNKFKSASYIFSKIKREFKSFDAVNQIDDADFPLYVAEVLKELGCGTYKEEEAVLTTENGKAELPENFMFLYAAYKANKCQDEKSEVHFQNGYFMMQDITCQVLKKGKDCALECGDQDKIIQTVTVRNYVGNDCCRTRSWNMQHLLTLSPNVRDMCCTDSPNIGCTNQDEITIANGCINTNFRNADIFIQYYALPLDDDGLPLVPDVIQIEKTIEWWIKYQLLLNSWFDGSIPDVQNKWGKAEQLYKEAMAESRYILKLPQFQTLINNIRRKRSINMVSYFSQQDRVRRY